MKILAKIWEQLSKHVLGSRLHRNIAVLTLLLILGSNILDKQCRSQEVDLTEQDTYRYHLLALFSLMSVLGTVVSSVISINMNVINALLHHRVYMYNFKLFSNFKWADWRSQILGDIYYSIVRQANGIPLLLGKLIFSFPRQIIQAVLMFGTLISNKENRIIVLILATAALSSAASSILQLFKRRAKKDNYRDFSVLSIKAEDMFINYKLIHIYGTIDKEIDEFAPLFRQFMISDYKMETFGFLTKLVKSIISFFLYAVVFREELPVQKLKLLHSNVKNSLEPISTLEDEVWNILNASVVLNINQFEKLNENRLSPPLMRKNTFDEAIEVRNLSNRYKNEVVYENVNLSIQRGSRIAITGANGSGKSTFIKQLLNLYDPKESVFIDGIDIGKIYLPGLVSYVPQETFIYTATLLDNLRCFDSSIPNELIYQTCMKLGIYKRFSEIGFSTMLSETELGLTHTDTRNISFVRAILKDTPILIVDELILETAEQTEESVVRMISEQLHDRTIIMIVHNMKLLHLFDSVIFFHNKTAEDVGRLYSGKAISHSEFSSYYSDNN